jgi:L-amino acid N-acyltransferase YncA
LKVEVLEPANWPALRAARLLALQDSPRSFASEYRLEQRWGVDEWLRTFENATWVIAREDDEVIGIARSVALPNRPAWERYVDSVWVAPPYRRTGKTGRLLRALVEAEPTAGIKELWLWLLDSNDEARHTYERLGFRPTGFRQRLKDGSGRSEERWHLGLAGESILF